MIDLPAPEGPTRAKVSPGFTIKDRSFQYGFLGIVMKINITKLYKTISNLMETWSETAINMATCNHVVVIKQKVWSQLSDESALLCQF